ncbi:hypothetical protein ACXJJ3_38600 [Kribbella sp. WER1]
MTRMLTYRWIWRSVAGMLLLLGLALAVLVLPAAVWLILASLAVPFGLMFAIGTRTPAVKARGACRRQVVMLTVAGYLVAVAAAVLIKVLGTGAVLLLGVVLVTSPAAVVRLLPTRPRKVPEATASTDQLCRQWKDSYAALSRARTSEARLRVVVARQHCLDELERRDPDGLQAWLASSAGAGSDPQPFLTDRS